MAARRTQTAEPHVALRRTLELIAILVADSEVAEWEAQASNGASTTKHVDLDCDNYLCRVSEAAIEGATIRLPHKIAAEA